MELTKNLDRILEEAINKEAPGCVLKVMKGDETIYEKAAGFRQIKPERKPVHLDTLFDIASLTKIVTSTMILQLISEGKFNLHTPLSELLTTKLHDIQERLYQVTIFQLLTHSSGLLNWHPFFAEKMDLCVQFEEFESMIFFDHNVGYSDLNFILLGKVIEKTTGQSLEEAFNRMLKYPLELDSMTFGPVGKENVAATEFGNRIEMKMVEDRSMTFDGWRSTNKPICGEVNDGNAHYFFGGVSGHAGLFSSIEDVCKIGRIYTDLTYAEKVGIQDGLIQAAGTPFAESRGLGFEFSSVFPNGFGHTGFTGTSLFIEPEHKVVTVLLTNRLHQETPTNLNELRRTIHETVCRYISE